MYQVQKNNGENVVANDKAYNSQVYECANFYGESGCEEMVVTLHLTTLPAADIIIK